MPKITVIIRAYNSGKFVKRAIGSVLKQTIPPNLYEIVVVNDGSTDDTLNVLTGYGDKIRIINQKHQGHVVAVNTGIKNSQGEYIILLDSDDEFLPDILEKTLKVFERNKSIAFVYCDYYENFPNGEQKKISLKKNIFNTLACGIIFKKEVLKDVGMYDENFVFAEYDLLMKLFKKNYKGKHLPIPLYIYNRREDSLTSDRGRVREAQKKIEERYGKINIRNY